MRHRTSGLLLAAIALVPTHADNWAVLVAGSSGYFNYRHQADLCHAYKVLIQHGLHPEHVVTMLFDDVAHAEDNPFPGELFNRPDGEDVYKGCGKDYVGEDVTPENFIAVLTGDSARVRPHLTLRVPYAQREYATPSDQRPGSSHACTRRRGGGVFVFRQCF